MRVKDVDIENDLFNLRSGKGEKDRSLMIPEKVKEALVEQIDSSRQIYEHGLEIGCGEVSLPGGLEKKYPYATQEWGWQ